jgi:hypothetical protein
MCGKEQGDWQINDAAGRRNPAWQGVILSSEFNRKPVFS